MFVAVAAMAQGNKSNEPLWMRYPAVSPDGKQIAFSYKGDVWVVPAEGGQARQLTTSPAYDYKPVWSPDSRKIAFASDRYGSFDVFVVSVDGGAPVRVTTNSVKELPLAWTPDGKYVCFSACYQKSAGNAAYGSTARLTELYKAPAGGGRPVRIIENAVTAMSWAPDGKSFLYIDSPGVENEWRKHQTSSVARSVWRYDLASGKHTKLTSNKGDNRDACVCKGGKMLFLSERNGGSFNIWSSPENSDAGAVALTSYKDNPVRFLSVAGDGLICYGYMGEIYTLREGGKPVKLAVSITSDSDNMPEVGQFGTVSQGTISADGSMAAFVSRGEIFVTNVDNKATRQITHTPAAESAPCFSPDGKRLAYVSERDGYYDIYEASLENENEPGFAYASLIKEKALFGKNSKKTERSAPKYSPDGKKIAFLEDRTYLSVADLASGKVTRVTDGSQYYSSTECDMEFEWSPDSKWLAITYTPMMHDPYSDVGVVSAEGGQIYPITETGYFAQNVSWVLDGKALIFASDRYGMRSHASWGSQEDGFICFLDQDAYDKFRLDKEDYARLKAEEKLAKKLAEGSEKKDEAKKDDKKATKKDEAKKDEKKDDFVPDFANAQNRIIRLTPMSSSLGGMTLSKDGETFYFMSRYEKAMDLWKVEIRGREVKLLAKNVGDGSIVWDGKMEKSFLLGRNLKKIDLSSGKTTNIEMDRTMELDRAAEREYMYDHVFLQQRKRYFGGDGNGADFARLQKEYRPFLAHINNYYDFSELLSEVLGEMNVSHSGSGYRGNMAVRREVVGDLGLFFDWNHGGDGLIVDEVIVGGPFDKKTSKVKKGDIIESIEGVKITEGMDYFPLLCGKVNKNVLVGVHRPSLSGKEARWTELVKVGSRANTSDLLYKRWIRQCEHIVDSLSGGQLGYVHISGMSDEYYREVYSKILGKYNDRKGVVVDIRFNGGGRLHEDVEILFSGEKYLEQGRMVNGEWKASCAMPSRRYDKPTVMLVEESCYSNAHGTPWVYRYKGMGRIVGMPVAGTMSSVTWENLIEPTVYFGLPIIGYRTKEGTFLENTQLEPDILVRNTPESLLGGRDLQLEAAVKALMEDLAKSSYWGK